MSEYNRFAGVNSDYEFPPEVRAALLESLNIRNVGAPMTTAQRNALNTADLDPGYYIFNIQTQTFQIWRADFEEWHDGLEGPGTQKWWAGSVIPSGWKKQDGASLSRTTYFALFEAIKTTYGGSDTPTHFRLPNTLGRMPVDSGGSFSLGSSGGAEKVALNVSHMPTHRHTGSTDVHWDTHSHTGATNYNGDHSHGYWWITDGVFNKAQGGGNHSVYYASRTFTNTGTAGAHNHTLMTSDHTSSHSHGFTTGATGGTGVTGESHPHENMPPYSAGHFIIKY